MSTQLKAVLFDLDGTLLDTAPEFHHCIDQLLKEKSLAPISFDALRGEVSNGARAMLRCAFSIQDDHPDLPALHQQMLEQYLINIGEKTHWFNGIPELLRSLEARNIRWGIVTNKPLRFTQPLLVSLGVETTNLCIICPDHVSAPKPSPEALLLACSQLGCSVDEAVYIGDHIRDIECGKNAGIVTIAAAYGYISPNENPIDWKADHIVFDAESIKPLLESQFTLNNP